MIEDVLRKRQQQSLQIFQSHEQTLGRRSETSKTPNQATLTSMKRSTVGIHPPLNPATPAVIAMIRSTVTPKTPHPVTTTTGNILTREIAAKAGTKSIESAKKADTEEKEDTTGTASATTKEEKEIPLHLAPLPPATSTDAEMTANLTKNQRNSTNTIAATAPTRREATTTSDI